jgi:hypothetical protein
MANSRESRSDRFRSMTQAALRTRTLQIYRVEYALGSGRRVYPGACPANIFRRRQPIDLQPGMRRPSGAACANTVSENLTANGSAFARPRARQATNERETNSMIP